MKTSFIIKLAPARIAIADISKISGNLYEINRINVPPEYRGRKHGRALLKQILVEADSVSASLRLNISPSGGLGLRKLQAWYARNAFTQRGDGYWYRDPHGAQLPAPDTNT